jgi:hypothetical protein
MTIAKYTMSMTEYLETERLTGVNCQVTWPRSTIDDHLEFKYKCRKLLPEGAKVSGGKESHVYGTWSNNGVLKLVQWLNLVVARRRFMISSATKAITSRKLIGRTHLDFQRGHSSIAARTIVGMYLVY